MRQSAHAAPHLHRSRASTAERPTAVSAAFAELRHAAAAARVAHEATSLQVFEDAYAAAHAAWVATRARTAAYVREQHAAQCERLQARFARAEEEAAHACPTACALRREQQALLSARQFTQAFEHLKSVKAAEAKAASKHRQRVQEANARAVAELHEEQTYERASLELFASETEEELRYTHARRLFELGATPAQIWPESAPHVHAGDAAAAQHAEQWGHARGFGHEHAQDSSWAHAEPAWDGEPAWREHGATAEQWRDASAHVYWDDAASAAEYHWPPHDPYYEHGAPYAEPEPLPQLGILAPIPAGWGGRAPPDAAAPARPPAAGAPEVDALSKLLSAAAVLVDRGAHAAAPQRADAAAAHAWRPEPALEPEDGLAAGSALPPQWRSQADTYAPPDARAYGSESAAAEWRQPSYAWQELSDDSSSDASTSSDGAALEPMRDAVPVAVVQPAAGRVPPSALVRAEALPKAAEVAEVMQQPPAPQPPPQASTSAASDAVSTQAAAPAAAAPTLAMPLPLPALPAPLPAAPAAADAAQPAPQSGLGALLAARRAAETAARASAAQRREFTTADFRQLFSLCRHGKYRQAKDLLKGGCPVDGRDQFGNTPLIVACQNGHARLAKALLRHGAAVDAANRSGNTALHYAVAFGFMLLADFLISQGADDTLRNTAGMTPYEGIK